MKFLRYGFVARGHRAGDRVAGHGQGAPTSGASCARASSASASPPCSRGRCGSSSRTTTARTSTRTTATRMRSSSPLARRAVRRARATAQRQARRRGRVAVACARPGAPRRPHRRGRPVRHRRRPPPPDRVPVGLATPSSRPATSIGGTWDLFKYPGLRSDSDMHTLGYSFRPWSGEKTIADGASILQYIKDTAAEDGTDQKIRYHHRILRAEWSTAEARWTSPRSAPTPARRSRLTCRLPVLAAAATTATTAATCPDFAGIDRFAGHGRAPAALARGPRLDRQEGRGRSAAAPPPSR